ncbi:hypothetical protein [Bizionia sp. M204]|uniref:hypothetical protein n=1 Tax=Bizionia sp. M204 TaxID=2675331 RepID=UPI0020BE1555|nr:hypothetical protein [Bizionia sp. M204]
MLTDKQSLILCGIVGVSFSVAGICGLLENYMISGIFMALFLAILINIIVTVSKHHKKNDDQTT